MVGAAVTKKTFSVDGVAVGKDVGTEDRTDEGAAVTAVTLSDDGTVVGTVLGT